MELEYMDNTKNDHYYLDKIKTDLAFIVAHMKDVDAQELNPDNIASRKTCEYLKGNLLEIAKLPEDNDMRILKGETEKCIFEFEL